MFKIESYVTPILLSYVDKYVRDFKPVDAQVSLWGGGVALHNLVLKADVLQQEVALPFTLVSGRIHELLIQVPWTKIMSEPIVVTIDTIECVLSLNPPAPSDDNSPPEPNSRKTQVVEAPPGYMQALVRRIVSNISLRVHHLIVKYVQDDIVLSLNVKHLAVDSAGINWEPAFADIDQNQPVIRRLVKLDDFTLCLDKADSDGKIRFYQEPLLYRCQLDLRVLTHLVSANTRRASSLSVQLRTTKLAWGVTNDQLLLLMRLIRERVIIAEKQPPPAPKQPTTQPSLHQTSANSAEPARSESWSEWAWSWLPTWMDKEGGAEEAPIPASPIPVFFTAYFDDISLVFKIMETEGVNRKRARSILELTATHAAIKTSIWSPTMLRVRIGARLLTLKSSGKCICGHVDYNALRDEPTVYLCRSKSESFEESWQWPEECLGEKIETAEAVDEQYKSTTENLLDTGAVVEGDSAKEISVGEYSASRFLFESEQDDFWVKMSPLLYFEYTHDRSPPYAYINPYENPPADFQYSDWVEQSVIMIKLEPIDFQLCMGLIHRCILLKNILQDLPPVPIIELPKRVLTVEECEALSDNLPERRIKVEVRGFRVRVIPWDHSQHERPTVPPLVLDVELPKSNLVITGPLYAHRVCSAACQIPEDNGPLWQGARLHVTGAFGSVQVALCSPRDSQQRPCARADLKLVLHVLLNRNYFPERSTVYSYSLKISELNVCGSNARLMAAWQVPMSLLKERVSIPLKLTTLAKDALEDEEAVAIDATLEQLALRGYLTANVNTHHLSLQSAKVTAFHEPKGGELKQAWLFSAPDALVTTPYLRIALQWCSSSAVDGLDYVGIWSEPTALSMDPLFIAWLAYKPGYKPYEPNVMSSTSAKSFGSSQYYLRRKATPPSSSGRGGSRTGSGAELVHVRPRSMGSSSEPSEKKEVKQPPQQAKQIQQWWLGERILSLHERLRYILVNVELGLVLVYITMSTPSALDCATIRDAMERHAVDGQSVLTLGFGRLSLTSNASTKLLWDIVKSDGPTFLPKADQNTAPHDSFPWKMKLADVSCYTLALGVDKTKADRTDGLKSTLKTQRVALPRTVLELVTTTLTLSVVTKSLHIKVPLPKKEPKKRQDPNPEEQRTRYFTAGMEFKPTTLKEFVRGPAKRQKQTTEQETKPVQSTAAETKIQEGPVVSLGFHVHADTPPIIIRLDHDQVHIVAAAVHCFSHMVSLLKSAPMSARKQSFTSLGGSHRSLIRSVSEMDELQTQSEDTVSETPDELISIFDPHSAKDFPVLLKTFFWFQWVVSRATLVVATQQVKLAFDIDDIISTVDLQTHYNQLKIKLTSASVRYYERQHDSDDWTAGVLGGRVLEVKEPVNAKDENHFLAITITQAQISNLPASWKEELHPKLLEEKSGIDTMWEIYVTLAPLEAVLQPTVLENIVALIHDLRPRSFCPLQKEAAPRSTPGQWPFFYLTAGGLRLLITCNRENQHMDDTIVFSIEKVAMNPHPENPICRRAVNTGTETSWLNPGGSFEGRQYEMVIHGVSVRSAQFGQLVFQETSQEMRKGTGGENPALKWSQPVTAPVITPILHPVDISCVLAPALYTNGILTSGPAVEVNLITDCAVELSIHQMELVRHLTHKVVTGLSDKYEVSQVLEEEKRGMCAYASLLYEPESIISLPVLSDTNVEISDVGRSLAGDSGVETSSMKTKTFEEGVKKSVSIVFAEQTSDTSEYLEVFVTMGIIELSLYVADNDSPEVTALRPPNWVRQTPHPPPAQPVAKEEVKETTRKESSGSEPSVAPSRSLTETVREQDVGKSNMNYFMTRPLARTSEGSVPLIHVTLYQPNLYYWKKRSQRSLQVSLFNAWIGLGMGVEAEWKSVILSTARGSPDPITDIPPALATMKVVIPCAGVVSLCNQSASRGTVTLDVERPVQIAVSTDNLRRLQGIMDLIEKTSPKTESDHEIERKANPPALYNLRRGLLNNNIESITMETNQFTVYGSEGAIAWDNFTLQLAAGLRPERLVGRSLVTALLVAAGPPADRRHLVLHPLMLGLELEATWEVWRRAEGGPSAREPTLSIGLEVDRLVMDVRPVDLAAVSRMQNTLDDLLGKIQRPPPVPKNSSETLYQTPQPSCVPYTRFSQRISLPSSESVEAGDHYYKDDLRSGAFKIVSGGQLPMAYQVMLHNDAVSWRYPHPRAITRLVAFPLPGQDKEIDCVLELYIPMAAKWEPHTYFKIPVGEPRELQLYTAPPNAVFAMMWRFRACSEPVKSSTPLEFNINRFMPRSDPLFIEPRIEPYESMGKSEVTAEQLSGVLRVDSYFAPRQLARTKVVVHVSEIEIHVHNALPSLSSQATALEGYYVSRPLMRSHRVFSVTARNTTGYANLNCSAGIKMLVSSHLSSDIIDCATGTMEQLVEEFKAQGGLILVPGNGVGPRTRFATSIIRVALHVPRLRTLHSLATDWNNALDQYIQDTSSESNLTMPVNKISKRELTATTAMTLEGRVSLWLHNSCASALRIGQECTDEVVPLGSGARLAYRWRSPTAPKRLHIAMAGPTADWHWSSSIPFAVGSTRVRLEDTQSVASSADIPGGGVFLHVSVEEIGSRRQMHLSGRLVLANMLRHNLLYKVRARFPETNQWQTVCSGEMSAESVGRSVICASDYEMILKLKFVSHETGWSGDIPLKECPKENVPWLVKVPSDGDLAYVSVWCRVTRGRSDGRILATVWPLYVLRSHLPLDADVLIATETESASTLMPPEVARPPPLVQGAPGRGTNTHLMAPGTTAARHSLSFQYRNIDCPVTREAVPLHYGVTDTSVFDKRTPVTNIDEVIDSILEWLARSAVSSPSDWPYSIVTRHWQGQWQPALLQPRCDITVRYQAIRAGGGCSLEVQLTPLALLCNASLQPLTLRAHDAAPLCKLEPGSAISPPSNILRKPFFISVEVGRDTFVSDQLEVYNGEPGQYGSPPPGQVALNHAADFGIQCNQKVALLTLYYEIKHEINVLGISSTYVLINRLDTELLVSAIALPSDVDKDVILRPKSFKVIQPTKEGSIHGTPLSRFWLQSRWRGGNPTELKKFLCIAFPAGAYPAKPPLPIEIGAGPARRPVGLVGPDDKSVPVVITHVRHDSRWIVTISPDPCPQFIVQNRTRLPIAVAQPNYFGDKPSTSVVTATSECTGVRWWCTVTPGAAVHYTTRAFCNRYPPSATQDSRADQIPVLTFAKLLDEDEVVWCSPVVVTDGEQLLQMYPNITIKMRVRSHPHSTLLELLDVDQNDISASDIRRRLHGAFSSIDVPNNEEEPQSVLDLERIGAESILLDRSKDVDVEESQYNLPTPPSFLTIRDASTTQEFSRTNEISIDNIVSDDFAEIPDASPENERVRCVIAGVQVEMASTAESQPLFALHLDRSALLIYTDNKKTKGIFTVSDIQVDNLQYDTGQFDFAVVASTRVSPLKADPWPPLHSMFSQREPYATRQEDARLLLKFQYEHWTVCSVPFNELTEVEMRLGPLALYIEDAYVTALVQLSRQAIPQAPVSYAILAIAEERALRTPLRLRLLHIHPLDLTLTLHTAVRMYIALDQSPLVLSAFKLTDMMTSAERLTHALTVHYLSAAILGAGWVVGGLELLGAPGALAARVGGATGGVRGVASAAAAALLRSLSAWAGSLARNLDLLAGDEEHARRAAAARRIPPPNFIAGLIVGITNFAINILGAVGGLAHHPLVGVAVGETESGAAALRRGLLGALTKPLSATADLVAFAGHGLLRQTGWDPAPQPRRASSTSEPRVTSGWRRDCVRWIFRLADLNALAGFEVLLDGAPLELLFTHKLLVVADLESERIVEMIDFRHCSLGPYQGPIIELCVTQRRQSKLPEMRVADDDDEYQISAAAMARVARYTGAEGGPVMAETRVLALLPAPHQALSLHAALAAAIRHNADTHFPIL